MSRPIKAHVGYSVTTDESIQNGECAEHGFWMPGGWEHALGRHGGHDPLVLKQAQDGEFGLSLREAIRAAENLGATHEIRFDGSTVTSRSDQPAHDRAYFERGESRLYTVLIDCGTPLRARLVAAALGAL